jgi:predicted MFS family arabinose efflux permease
LLPTVLLLLAGGVIVDRVPRRLAMLGSDVTRGAAVTIIAALIALGDIQAWHLIVMSVIFGAADALFFPASTAVLPEILPAELLVQGSALNATSQTSAQVLIGPALGGLLTASLGYSWAFAVDAASFLVSGCCLLAMSSRPRPQSSGRSPLTDARDGLRYCRSQPWLWGTIISAGLANFVSFSPLALLIPLLIHNVLHDGSVALGLVFAAGGFGGIVTSLLVIRLGVPRRRITAMWVGWALAGAAVLGIALAPSIWLVGAFEFIAFGLLQYGNVLWNPLMQELVPPELIGRASSVDWMVSLSLSPLGVIVAGAAAGVAGIRTTMLIGAAIAVVLSGVLFLPGVRDPERQVGVSSAPL